MDKDSLTKILNFESDISDDGSVEIPQENLRKLKEKGYRRVQIVLFGSAESAAGEMGIDINQFNKIRELQTLPETVVLDFLNVKGALSNSNFKKRITFE